MSFPKIKIPCCSAKPISEKEFAHSANSLTGYTE
jgi:hypothetical protein